MPPAISVVVSTLALTISMVTAWLTLFRRGTVRMTRPTAIYFGADGSVDPSPKVYLRTLLYSTAKRGQIVESMFVKLRRGESIQTFNIWAYGEASLARGSGLYVGENGVTCDWLLKNSLSRKRSEKLCNRKPYNRRTLFW